MVKEVKDVRMNNKKRPINSRSLVGKVKYLNLNHQARLQE